MQATSKKQLILVVDDQPINIKLLQRKLEREGFDVLTAYNGQECLDIVAQTPPDLILLDVMMPEMDGIETCERLKQEEETETIPVIFITAKSSKEGKLEGLGVGAVDYITKPIDLEETLARVKTQLRIQEIYRENIELQTQLGEIRRSAAVGAITQGIAHNLNNLLGVVVGYLDLLRNGYDSPDMVQRSVALMDQAIQRMVNIIRHLSSIATSENVQLTSHSPIQLIEECIAQFTEDYEIGDQLTTKIDLPDSLTIDANRDVFTSAFTKILLNAYECYPKATAEEKQTIRVEANLSRDGDSVILKVIDQGPGISDDVRDHLFDPFITTKTSVGRGLGLTMARHSIRNIKGEITLEDGPTKGCIATMIHPVEQPPLPMVDGPSSESMRQSDSTFARNARDNAKVAAGASRHG